MNFSHSDIFFYICIHAAVALLFLAALAFRKRGNDA